MLPAALLDAASCACATALRKSSTLSSALNGKNRRTRKMRIASVIADTERRHYGPPDRCTRFHEALAEADRNIFRIPNQLRHYCLIQWRQGFWPNGTSG